VGWVTPSPSFYHALSRYSARSPAPIAAFDCARYNVFLGQSNDLRVSFQRPQLAQGGLSRCDSVSVPPGELRVCFVPKQATCTFALMPLPSCQALRASPCEDPVWGATCWGHGVHFSWR
jgi:hypothetical protein